MGVMPLVLTSLCFHHSYSALSSPLDDWEPRAIIKAYSFSCALKHKHHIMSFPICATEALLEHIHFQFNHSLAAA